ncbi:hypothetical protein NBRC116597_00050 [Phaeobacter sp. NW0010-22]
MFGYLPHFDRLLADRGYDASLFPGSLARQGEAHLNTQRKTGQNASEVCQALLKAT